MSVNMSGGMDDTDYGEFEYQQAEVELFVDPVNTSNPNVGAVTQIEPLDKLGGLDNNEVAELVAIDVHACLEYEDAQGPQGLATMAEHRGTVGINLPESESSFLAVSANVDVDFTGSITSDDDGVGDDNILVRGRTTNDDNKLIHFRSYGGLPFNDAGASVSGSGNAQPFDRRIHYRDETGRGPVIDNNDDISVAQNLTVEDATIPVLGAVRMAMIWDVAETDDAGRRFSVPQ